MRLSADHSPLRRLRRHLPHRGRILSARLRRLTRIAAELMGRVRSARASPGVALMFCTVSTKTSASRDRYPEAFGSRIFNPLRWRPPAGRELAFPGPRGRFQPAPVATVFRLREDGPAVRPESRRSVRILPSSAPTRRAPRNRPTDTSRSTTPEGRIGRRTCALPVPSGGIRIRAVRRGGDQKGSRKFKALKSLSFVRYSPSMDAFRALPCPLHRHPRTSFRGPLVPPRCPLKPGSSEQGPDNGTRGGDPSALYPRKHPKKNGGLRGARRHSSPS